MEIKPSWLLEGIYHYDMVKRTLYDFFFQLLLITSNQLTWNNLPQGTRKCLIPRRLGHRVPMAHRCKIELCTSIATTVVYLYQ